MTISIYKFRFLLFCITLWFYVGFSQCTPGTATEPFPNGDFNMFTPPTAQS